MEKDIPKKINILVIRYNSDGYLMDSKPCKDCIEMMRAIGIHKVYHSTPEHKITAIKLQNLHSEHISWGYRYILSKTKQSRSAKK